MLARVRATPKSLKNLGLLLDMDLNRSETLVRRILILTSIALAALIGLPLPAAAAPIATTISLDTVYVGGTPDGTAPWLTAEFTSSVGSTTGTLVLTSHTPDFVQGLNSPKAVIGWAFYLDQGVSTLSCNTGKCADNEALYKASGLNTGPVPGIFNLGFGWSSGNRFMGGDTVTYNLTFSNALTGSPFVDNTFGWSSVAHVQGITSTTDDCSSGWIVSGDGSVATDNGSCTRPPVVVPEPGELGMFGLGLLFAGLFLGLRRRYS
jgi:hypothetical protein